MTSWVPFAERRNIKMKKRIVAFLLVLAMMMSSFGEVFQSRAYYAVAEGEMDSGSQPGNAGEGDLFIASDTDLKAPDTSSGDDTPATYQITYLIGEEVFATENCEAGAAITAPNPEAREGYSFSGWSGLPATMPDGNLTVTGSWNIHPHTVNYLIDGEQAGEGESYPYGTELTQRDIPEAREGYTFSGWNGLPDTMPDKDVTVTGTWIVNSHTVTYLIDGEQSGEAETYPYGAELTQRKTPEAREGFTFSGWSSIPDTMPDEDVVITGGWIEDQDKTAADDEQPSNLRGVNPLGSRNLLGNSGDGSGSDASGSTMTALEQIIEEKFKDMGNTLSGRIRIILNNNTTYSGESTITARQRTVTDDFVLELVASDAGENGMKGNGQTVIDDNLFINGLKVIMESIVIAAGKKVTVRNAVDAESDQQNRGGALEYKGVEGLPTELNADVGMNSSLDVTTAGKDDKITVTASTGADHVSINAGDGLNKILTTVSGGDLSIQTGKDPDDVEVRIAGSAEASQIGDVIVDTGAGNDTLYVMNDGQSKNPTSQQHNVEKTETVQTPDGQDAKDDNGNVITRTYKEDELHGIVVSAGSGDDTITLDVRSNAGNMILNTGAGGDIVDVRKGDLNTAEDLDYHHVFTPYEKVNDHATAKVIIHNGAVDPSIGGDAVDFVTIDVSVARAIREIELKGGKGASVHLKGMLATPSAGEAIRWKDESRKTLEVHAATVLSPLADHQLEITTSDENASYQFTDKLSNKKQKALYINDNETEYSVSLALEDFTDYVIKSSIANVNRISITNTNENNPFLSNLVLDIDETHDENDTLSVNNIYNGAENNKKAIPLNILVKAPTIEFNGTVMAQNVRAESVQGSREFDYMATISRSLDDTIDNAINLYDCAEVIVNKDAVIATEHDTVLVARVKHFGGTLALAWMLNIANIKVATAAVQIDGTITAGGHVTADARIETQEGNKITDVEGEAGNPTGVFITDGDAVPVGIKFVLNDASVIVGRDATITAEEDVLLRSRSDVTVYNYENGTLPFAVAATYINADVKTIVEGTVTAGRSALVQAEGIIHSDTQANHRKDTQDSSVNVFVGLNVVDQDVDAIIRGGKVTAHRGDVAVYATAIADIKTIASAAAMQQEMTSTLPEAMNPVGLLVSGLKGLLYPFKAGYQWIRGKTRKAD